MNKEPPPELGELLKTGEDICLYQKKRQKSERQSVAIAVAGLSFLVIALTLLIFRPFAFLPQSLWFAPLLVVLVVPVLAALATYLILDYYQSRKKYAYLDLLGQVEALRLKGWNEETESQAAALAAELLAVLPGLRAKKNSDASGTGSAVGALVFLLTLFVFPVNIALGLLIGVAIWLYYRYEAFEEYREYVSILRSWRSRSFSASTVVIK